MDHQPPFMFDSQHLRNLAQQHVAAYRQAEPFAHTVIDNFLPQLVAERILELFPPVDSPVFANRSRKVQPGKYGTVDASRLQHAHPWLQQFLQACNSYPMLDFLERLTGIKHLISDPYFHGGGLHQIVNSGSLELHADFNFQPDIRLFRRINILLYLNKDWRPEYGGQLELWQHEPLQRAHHIEPVFNRCVIFNTGKHSLHGHPKPLTLPDGMTRKSIALYYYTRDPAAGDARPRRTIWIKTPAADNSTVAKAEH